MLGRGDVTLVPQNCVSKLPTRTEVIHDGDLVNDYLMTSHDLIYILCLQPVHDIESIAGPC